MAFRTTPLFINLYINTEHFIIGWDESKTSLDSMIPSHIPLRRPTRLYRHFLYHWILIEILVFNWALLERTEKSRLTVSLSAFLRDIEKNLNSKSLIISTWRMYYPSSLHVPPRADPFFWASATYSLPVIQTHLIHGCCVCIAGMGSIHVINFIFAPIFCLQ